MCEKKSGDKRVSRVFFSRDWYLDSFSVCSGWNLGNETKESSSRLLSNPISGYGYFCSSASEVALTATGWLDPSNGVTHEPEMRRSMSDNGPPKGSDGEPSDTTEDDWSRGSAEDPDELPSPTSSPLPSPAEPPEHTGPITELDRKVRWSKLFFFPSWNKNDSWEENCKAWKMNVSWGCRYAYFICSRNQEISISFFF